MLNTSHSNRGTISWHDLIGHPPGILKEITECVLQDSFALKPEHALAAAISLAASVLGRRYCDGDGLQTNLFLLSAGPEASGKRRSMRTVDDMLRAVDMEHLTTGEFADREALIARTAERKTLLIQMDALNTLLFDLAADNLTHRDISIMNDLVRLYKAADSTFGLPDRDGDDEADRSIDHPCVNVHISLTFDSLLRALASLTTARDFLQHFLVVPCQNLESVDRTARDIVLPASILQWIRAAASKNADGDYQPIRVSNSPEAEAILERFAAEVDERIETGGGFAWRRAQEQARKVALVAACADDIVHPHISESHAQWAVDFVAGCADLTQAQMDLATSGIPFSGYGVHSVH